MKLIHSNPSECHYANCNRNVELGRFCSDTCANYHYREKKIISVQRLYNGAKFYPIWDRIVVYLQSHSEPFRASTLNDTLLLRNRSLVKNFLNALEREGYIRRIDPGLNGSLGKVYRVVGRRLHDL